MNWQVSMFIVVSSASKYAEHLGGTATFAGLVIGIPVVFAGIALLPLMTVDRGASHCTDCQDILIFRPISRSIHHPNLFRMCDGYHRSHSVWPGLSCQLSLPDPHRALHHRLRLHKLHVLQAFLLRRPNSRYPPAHDSRGMACRRPGNRVQRRSVRRGIVVSGRVRKLYLQWILEPRVGHGRCMGIILGVVYTILRGRPEGTPAT